MFRKPNKKIKHIIKRIENLSAKTSQGSISELIN